MRFMIIVKATPDSEAGRFAAPAVLDTLMAAMGAYHEALAKAGALLDAAGLQPSARGWRMRYDGARRELIDGPFADAVGQIAGYTLIECRTREEAVEWMRRFPNPAGEGVACEIEVRQLYDFDDVSLREIMAGHFAEAGAH